MVTLFVLSETLAKRQQQPILEVKGSVPVTGFIHEAKDLWFSPEPLINLLFKNIDMLI